MRYDPKDEERFEPFAAGEYDFEVQGATEKTSKSGNEMTELRVKVYAPNGATSTIYDYLVSSPKTLWKVRQFCEAVSIDYATGDIDAAMLPGKRGRCVLIIEKQPGFDTKNKIAGYIPGSARPAGAAPKGSAMEEPPPPDDSDVPF